MDQVNALSRAENWPNHAWRAKEGLGDGDFISSRCGSEREYLGVEQRKFKILHGEGPFCDPWKA